jgi:hypothetical protein
VLVYLHGLALHDVLGVVDLALDDHLVQLLLVALHLAVLLHLQGQVSKGGGDEYTDQNERGRLVAVCSFSSWLSISQFCFTCEGRKHDTAGE